MSSNVAITFCIPTSNEWVFLLLLIPSPTPALGVVSVPHIGQANRCVIVSQCCFSLHFPDDVWCGVSFHSFFKILLLFNYSRLHFLPTPPPHPSQTHLPPPSPPLPCFMVRYLLRSLANLLNMLCVSYCWVLRILCIFCITVLYQMCLLQIFSPSLWLVF